MQSNKGLAKFIDHTLLRPDALPSDILRLCDEAVDWGFFSVCVNPWHVERCAAALAGQPVIVCTVIGFPLGANRAPAKKFEAEDALKAGAGELDMVINLGALKSGDR